MFDWDRDYSDTVSRRSISVTPVATPVEPEISRDRPAVPARRMTGLLPALTLVLGLVIGAVVTSAPGFSLQDWLPGGGLRDASPVSVSGAFADPAPVAPRPEPAPAAPTLQVYEAQQEAAFRRGVSRFSDTDLETLAAALVRDLQAPRPRGFETHGADLLTLVRHELALRNPD